MALANTMTRIASLFEPAFLGVSLERRTSLSEIDIVLQIFLDVRSARQERPLSGRESRWRAGRHCQGCLKPRYGNVGSHHPGDYRRRPAIGGLNPAPV
jgi:hypothetical protein